MSFHHFQESQAKFAEHEFCGGRVSLGQEKREFVSAETPDVIADTQITSQARGYLNQQLISHRMAQRVVYLLEVVEIDIGNRKRPTMAEASSKLFIKCLIKCSAVGNGSQWIDAG